MKPHWLVAILAGWALFGCKKASTTSVKSLDSLASGKQEAAPAQCFGSYASKAGPNEARVLEKLPKDAQPLVSKTLTSLPPSLREAVLSTTELQIVDAAELQARCVKEIGDHGDSQQPYKACKTAQGILLTSDPKQLGSALIKAFAVAAYEQLDAKDATLSLLKGFVTDVHAAKQYALADVADNLGKAMPVDKEGKPLADEKIALDQVLGALSWREHDIFAGLVFVEAFDTWYCTAQGRSTMDEDAAFKVSGASFAKELVPALEKLRPRQSLGLTGGGLLGGIGQMFVGMGRFATGKWARLVNWGGQGGWVGGRGLNQQQQQFGGQQYGRGPWGQQGQGQGPWNQQGQGQGPWNQQGQGQYNRGPGQNGQGQNGGTW